MGFTGKAKNQNSNGVSSSENWGLGFLFVFFPEENPAAIVDKDKLFSSSSSLRRNSSGLLLARAQSTISICALLVFISLLFFTLSTFEPPMDAIKAQPPPARRFSSQKLLIGDDVNSTARIRINPRIHRKVIAATALQGMGKLLRRGTRAMHDLLVCHVVEETVGDELRLYLRLLHISGIAAKSDAVFIFPSQLFASRFNSIIEEENDWFLKLIRHYQELKLNSTSSSPGSGFDPAPFLALAKEEKEAGRPLWGKKVSGHRKWTRVSYGSVVSFEAAELDPENSLAGFSDHVPMNLRRWACYPLLLGRIRRNYRHVILVEVKNTFLLGDPLGRVRNKAPESVFIYTKPEQQLSGKHGRKNSERTRQRIQSNSAILMGGSRGIRRLSNLMLTAIVQALMQQKKKGPVSESEILSQLAGNELNEKYVDFIKSPESVPEFPPAGLQSSDSSTLSIPELTVVEHGNSNFDEFNDAIRKKICVP